MKLRGTGWRVIWAVAALVGPGGVARADEGLTTLLVPHPLAAPDRLAAPDPLAAPGPLAAPDPLGTRYRLSTDAPLAGDRPLVGGTQRQAAIPCSDPSHRRAPVAASGSGAGEYAPYVPAAAPPATLPRSARRAAPGVDRPLWGGPGSAVNAPGGDRPLWSDGTPPAQAPSQSEHERTSSADPAPGPGCEQGDGTRARAGQASGGN